LRIYINACIKLGSKRFPGKCWLTGCNWSAWLYWFNRTERSSWL